jgi:hypothetical protein
MNIKRIASASLGIIFFTFLIASCRTKGDTLALVTVKDMNNQSVENATVRLYGSGTEGVVVLNKTASTNSNGEAAFNFNDVYQLGQAGVAIVDIEVTKSGETAQGIMKIEQETTSKETVFIQL